jgi:hypothetical protein
VVCFTREESLVLDLFRFDILSLLSKNTFFV